MDSIDQLIRTRDNRARGNMARAIFNHSFNHVRMELGWAVKWYEGYQRRNRNG